MLEVMHTTYITSDSQTGTIPTPCPIGHLGFFEIRFGYIQEETSQSPFMNFFVHKRNFLRIMINS